MEEEDNSLLDLRPVLIHIDCLKEHEECDPDYLEELLEKIVKDGELKRPIIVDSRTMIILDGHHRFLCIKKLGKRYIPAYLIDYSRPEIEVCSWNNTETITKEMVIEAALTGKKFPPKSTKHMVKIGGELYHITYIEKEHPYPLHAIP
ncbi:MAG: ParB N-terminal domain-containing protein [Nitrososphaerota archaeon]